MNKKQIIFNDPIYGFITVPDPLIHKIINQPYFLRLQRIPQLVFQSLVYPGALHTRFQHAMGAMHLTSKAIETLREKNIEITNQEERGVLIAVLLHDIGHGPFSHALEHSIVEGISHEDISILFLEKLNKEFKGELSVAIEIFKNTYKKKFLHQLVSSQLDMDRLDYLNRDSFFTGVTEGVISSDRIIKMLNVKNDELVVEAKGIYSVEKFIIARRLMYWQVYLHKTVLSAEFLLVKILERAKEIASQKSKIKSQKLFATPELQTFLYNSINKKNILKYLDDFALLDDSDVSASLKAWIHPVGNKTCNGVNSDDVVLSKLCEMLVNRKLYKVWIQSEAFDEKQVANLKKKVQKKYKLSEEEANYFVFSQAVTNDAYRPDKIRINILYKDGKIADIAKASDQEYISALQKTVKKYFLCFPKEIL